MYTDLYVCMYIYTMHIVILSVAIRLPISRI